MVARQAVIGMLGIMAGGIVYLATNQTTGQQYVGITGQSFRKRWIAHLCAGRRPGPTSPLHKAIAAFGAATFTTRISEHCPDRAALHVAEKKWIKALGTKYPFGYNLTRGGAGAGGLKHSVEFCRKLGDRMRGRQVSEETRRRIAAAKRGKKQSPELVARRAAARIGTHHSEETRAKIRQSNLGKKRPRAGIEAGAAKRRGRKIGASASAAISRPIVAGGVEFASIKEAAAALGVSIATVARRAAKGWEGYREIRPATMRRKRTPDQIAALRARSGLPVLVEGLTYPSIQAAAAALGLTRPGVAYRIKIGRTGYAFAS